MDSIVYNALLVAFFLFLQTFTITYAVLTIQVTADKCDNEYQIFLDQQINLVYDSKKFKNSSLSRSEKLCHINIFSACNDCQICVYNKVYDDSFCSGMAFLLFFGYTPSSPYDSDSSFSCFDTRTECTTLNMVSAQFRPTYRRALINVQFFLQVITTTEEPITTPYVYKSSKGKFDLIASLMVPIGIVGGVCGCTCIVICCVLFCRKCCKDEDTPTTANRENNENFQQINQLPAILPSAPVFQHNDNQIPLQTHAYRPDYSDDPRPYNYSDEPPDYDRALLSSIPTEHSQEDSSIETKADTRPPPPPYYPGM
ncbi:hypothetical protein ACF0H5_014924 [Mactra antiquata]